MGRHAKVLAVALAVASAAVFAESEAPAEPTGTLESGVCGQALDALQAQEAVVVAARASDARADDRGRRGIDPRVQALRRQAARICLGGRGDPTPPSQHLVQPPIVVPPVTAAARAGLPPVQAVVVPPLPAPKADVRPSIVTGCDAVGCWASDGTRLLRVGPNLQGPRGLCSVQGGVLNCP